MSRLVVPEELAGERLDKVVAVLAGLSRAEARQLCDDGLVKVEGSLGAARHRLEAGAVIELETVERRPLLVPEPIELQIMHQDDHLLVVDKPAGMVVHPGVGKERGSLAAGLLHAFPELEGVGEEGRWGIVHRLDRDTSGLLVVARTAETHHLLTRALAARRIERTYLALAVGAFEVPRGTVDAPIGPDPNRPSRRTVIPGGRPARTHYRVVEQWDTPEVALLEVTLETGRTHQIRVHLSAIDHPLAGDRVYGRPAPVDSPRVFLHATRLAFDHPITGDRVEVASPLPPDLAGVLEQLG